MKLFLLLNCLSLVIVQNVVAQARNIGNNYSISNTNSVVSGNAGINNLASNAASLANSQISGSIAGNSVVSNNIGNNNIGASYVNTPSTNTGNSQIYVNANGANVAGNSVVSNNIAYNNVASNQASNLGNVLTSNNVAGATAPNVINLESFLQKKEMNVANNEIGGFATGINNAANIVLSNANTQNIAGNAIANNAVANGVQLAGTTARNIGSVGVNGVREVEQRSVIGYVTFEGYLPVEGTVSAANINNCGCGTA